MCCSESDFRVKMMPRFQKEALEKNVALLERVQALADAKGCTPGQLALAWVHSRVGRPSAHPFA